MALQREVDGLIDHCRKEALRRSAQLPPLPPQTVVGVAQFWEEVRRSFILRQYAAALSLGSAFLEFLLEKAVGSSEEMTLNQAIDAAKSKGLLEDSTAQLLHKTRRLVRNAYAHGDYEKITSSIKVTYTEARVTREQVVWSDPLEFPLNEFPEVQVMKRRRMDAEFSRPVLQHIRWLACDLLEKVPELRRSSKNSAEV